MDYRIKSGVTKYDPCWTVINALGDKLYFREWEDAYHALFLQVASAFYIADKRILTPWRRDEC